MTAPRFAEQLNEQIGNEFAAHQQYVACAIHYDGLTMPQMAGLFYKQALEERDHAMMMVRFLLDTDCEVKIPGVPAPHNSFGNVVAPVELALAQEKQVAEQIFALTRTAREENDFAAEQFMQWFIKEQVEEIAKMHDLLNVVTRSQHDVDAIEEYLRREHVSVESDPTAPGMAGA